MANRPTAQTATLVFGVIYLVAGILGFLPFAQANGAIFGLFKVNAVHNLVHIVIGIGGLAAAASVANSRAFCRIAGVGLLLLGLLGIFVSSPLGLLQIGGSDIALHLVSGAILAYFGFEAPLNARR